MSRKVCTLMPTKQPFSRFSERKMSALVHMSHPPLRTTRICERWLALASNGHGPCRDFAAV